MKSTLFVAERRARAGLLKRTSMSAASAVLALALPAAAQTALTYQGQLKEAGATANGEYDLVFRLYDAPSGGSQIGGSAAAADWPVIDGLFTLQLDFGANVFDGSRRWLQIEVRPGGSGGAYTVLSPRQPLSAVPYALYALGGPGGGSWSASGSDIYNSNSGNVGVGTASPIARLDVRGSGTNLNAISVRNGGGDGDAISVTATGAGAAITAYANSSADALNVWQDGSGLAADIYGDALFRTGTVSIGNTSPRARLDVLADTAGSSDNTARFQAPNIGPHASHVHYGARGDWYIRSARDDGKVVIQDSGGVVELGPNRVHPVLAYGRVDGFGGILSASGNVTNVAHVSGGDYRVAVEGGFLPTDVMIVTATHNSPYLCTAIEAAAEMRVRTYDVDDARYANAAFSFVVYRP